MTEILSAKDIDRAVGLLAAGQLVAFPTETVYGLGADARNTQAVAGIYEAKKRPSFNPLIVHVGSLEAAQEIGRFDGDALRLAQSFWPGPLTVVVPVRPEAGISDLVTAGLETVALRVPASPLATRLLTQSGLAIAAPSANPSGTVSPTTAEHVIDGLEGRIAAVIDGGACDVGVESTIVATDPVRLLRPGGLPLDALEACLARPVPTQDGGAITAPGQLLSHYAPDAVLRLNVVTPQAGEFFIGFGPMRCDLNLSEQGDLREAAANLFSSLRQLNALNVERAAVAPIPQTGIGLAINDRLTRAAAPRS